MPIQFRCQNCRQLLGISRSKAGSVVDCPACGRSLRVPGVDGTIAVPEPVPHSAADTNLRNALEELRNLPTSIRSEPLIPSMPAGSGLTNAGRQSSELSSSQPQQSHKDTMRIVPLSSASSVLPAETSADVSPEILHKDDDAPLVIPEPYETEIIDESGRPVGLNRSLPTTTASTAEAAFDLPDHLAHALQELAGHAPAVAAAESRSDAVPSRTRFFITLTVFTAIVSFLLGYLTARFEGTSQGEVNPATNQPASAKPIMPAVKDRSETVQTITGSVQYSDSGRGPNPDAEALILLLPSENTSGLKLDARPLRTIETSPAKAAVETALNVLGATFTRAADDGTFSLERRHAGPATLIVISRHASRPDSESVPPAIAAILAEWFESPAHLTGRLSVQEKRLPAAGAGESPATMEIVFGSIRE